MNNTLNKQELEFIKNLAKEMATQDNRWTQNVGFMIQETKEELDYHKENIRKRKDGDDIGEELLCDECKKKYWEDEDLPNDCDDCDEEAFYWVKEEEVLNTRWPCVFLIDTSDKHEFLKLETKCKRNSQCFCWSGKKYKKCCMNK